MLRSSKEYSLVCSNFIDVINDSQMIIEENYISKYVIENLNVTTQNLVEMRALLSAVAGKLVHKEIIQDTRFNTDLKSGEDVVFFSEISNRINNIIIVDDLSIAYYRVLRESSVSRQSINYEFNITHRLNVIRELNKLLFNNDKYYNREFIKLRIKAQSKFIKNYIAKYPDENKDIIDLIKKDEKILYFPFSDIFNNKRKLVFSYCFPPYNDPSGIVTMKRIIDDFYEKEIISDVIQNNMDNIRNIDENLKELSDTFVGKQVEIITEPYFKPKYQIKYAKKAYKFAKKLNEKYNYKEIYSRVMWPGSHFAALFYKITQEKIFWQAEFSDPVLYREGKLRKSKRFKFIDNFWFWLEFLPYLFADQIIYTNENQREYMLSYFPIKIFKKRILKKSIIKNQPTLESKYYNYKNNKTLSKNKINIGYFGSFYKNRNISIVLDEFKKLDEDIKNNIEVHIYTNNISELREYVELNSLNKYIKMNKYVDYFTFLNISSKFDILLVNDTLTKENIGINPYLPSKYSDYRGSGSLIWAVVEEGSPLSKKEDIQYFSFANDNNSIRNILIKINKDLDIKCTNDIEEDI